MHSGRILALYERLSIEDRDVRVNDRKSESDSISHQRKLLFDFVGSRAEFEGYSVEEYKDDGYSGTNFDRPMFLELMKKVRTGQVAIIIVKDFSRLGRDYLEAGNFLDRIFPAYGVRFIAVNDHYDSDSHLGQTAGIEVSFRNIVNEMYSRDISRKNKTAMLTRYRRGEYMFAEPFYGYLKDQEDKHRLAVDQEAAVVVRRIFELCIGGMSTADVAAVLNKEGILSPTAFKKARGIRTNHRLVSNEVLWSKATVRKILKDERYLGNMVSGRYRAKSIGSKKVVAVPREEWVVVEGTHEALVSEQVFQKAQEALAARAKGRHSGSVRRDNLFTCPYCGHKLQFRSGPEGRAVIFCGYGYENWKEGCRGILLDKLKMEAVVVETLYSMGEMLGRRLNAEREAASGILEEWKRKLAECETARKAAQDVKRNAYMQYSGGGISREKYGRIREDMEARCSMLEEKCSIYEREIEKAAMKRKQEGQIAREIETVFRLREYRPDVVGKVVRAVYLNVEGEVELEFWNGDLYEELLETRI